MHLRRLLVAVALVGLLGLTGTGPSGADEIFPEEDFGPVPAGEGWEVTAAESISIGVQHLRVERDDGPVVAHVARLEPQTLPRVRTVLSNELVAGDGDRRETTSDMCRRAQCVAAVNGDFFTGSGVPDGPVVSRGELVLTPEPGTVPLLLDGDGRPWLGALDWSVVVAAAGRELVVDAVNRPPRDGEVALFTTRYGPRTGTGPGTVEVVVDLSEPGAGTPPGTTPLRVRAIERDGNTRIGSRQAVLVASGADAGGTLEGLYGAAAGGAGGDGVLAVSTGGASEAIGGRPGLVGAGRYLFWPENPAEQVQGRAPRTAVGWTAEGTMLWVAVDGRRAGHSAGLSLPEAAQLLVSLGAVEAVNLDGGGSTTFVVGGGVRNRPSDSTGERAVANALVVGPPPLAAERLSGPTRYDTAVVASRQLYPEGAPLAIIASGERFPDALAGAVLAARAGGPLLLVERDRIPPVVVSELARLGIGRAAILGGTAAVSATVEAELAFVLRGQVLRISGPTRYATSAFVSAAAFPDGAPVAYLATGRAFPDALAASAAVGGRPGPVLLVDGAEPVDEVAAELHRLRVAQIVVVGGAAAVPDALVDGIAAAGVPVERLSGATRYETAAAVTHRFGPERPAAVLATGETFPDGLTGASVAAAAGLPLLLVPQSCVPGPAMGEADRRDVQQVYVMGGTAATSPALERLAPCP